MSGSPADPPPRPGCFFLTLIERPRVFCVAADHTMRGSLGLVLKHAQGQPCTVLAVTMWRLPRHLRELTGATALLAREHPHVRLVVLVPLEQERALLSEQGVEALHIHQNAFIDERIYYPELGAQKLYRAVHNAQTGAFKRHHLAHAVADLALITMSERGSEGAVRDVVSGYQDLAYVNWDPTSGSRFLAGDDVRAVVSQARCGLILSAEEGANYASTEYLLCGVPVVSTPSTGGRHVFFDPRHVAIVEPQPDAVVEAVARMETRSIDPLEVRESVLIKMREHRRRLIYFLSHLAGEDLYRHADSNGWLPQFRDKLRRYVML